MLSLISTTQWNECVGGKNNKIIIGSYCSIMYAGVAATVAIILLDRLSSRQVLINIKAAPVWDIPTYDTINQVQLCCCFASCLDVVLTKRPGILTGKDSQHVK